MKRNLERAGELLLEAHKLLGDYHELQEAIEIVFEGIDAEIDYEDEREIIGPDVQEAE